MFATGNARDTVARVEDVVSVAARRNAVINNQVDDYVARRAAVISYIFADGRLPLAVTCDPVPREALVFALVADIARLSLVKGLILRAHAHAF